MLKISFFGASVTQQKEGYAQVFSDINPGYACSIFGYGARHLKDAGICLIDAVIQAQADFVFIDWFSTGFIKPNNIAAIKEYINTQVYKFISANIRPIYLFLPQMDDVKSIYVLIQEYLNWLNVPYIDLVRHIEQPADFLRDAVHTNAEGSIQYARLISNYFSQHWYRYPSPVGVPPPNKYCDIKSLEINLQIPSFIEFEGECEVIGISQYVGPYTGYIVANNTIYQNWDRWCYYEREMINLPFSVVGTTRLTVLDYEFDRGACDQSVQWPVKKLLKLLCAYYVGDTLRLKTAA
jgi:hypothetical protein